MFNEKNLIPWKFICKDKGRKNIAGVFFQKVKDRLITVATNGYLLFEVSTGTSEKQEDFESFVVRNKPVMDGEDFIVYQKGDEVVFESNSKKKLHTMEPHTEKYPNYERVFPKGKGVEVRLDATYLLKMAQSLKKFKDDNIRIPEVTMIVYGKEDPVYFEAETPGQKARGLIMPIRY